MRFVKHFVGVGNIELLLARVSEPATCQSITLVYHNVTLAGVTSFGEDISSKNRLEDEHGDVMS